ACWLFVIMQFSDFEERTLGPIVRVGLHVIDRQIAGHVPRLAATSVNTRSGHRGGAVTLFVLLSRTAGAGLVATHLGCLTTHGLLLLRLSGAVLRSRVAVAQRHAAPPVLPLGQALLGALPLRSLHGCLRLPLQAHAEQLHRHVGGYALHHP